MSANADQPFTIAHLEQGSAEWHQWRSGGIGASEAPAIMGESRWKSAAQLLRERRNPSAVKRQATWAMERGIMLEPRARDAYNVMRGIDVQPLCLQSREHAWMRCSLDGICLETMQAVEIKCGDGVYKNAARNLAVPDYYYGQLQHTMAVTGLPVMDFYCYLPGRQPIVLKAPRDDAYIARLITAEAAFWEAVSA